MTKPDLVDWRDAKVLEREEEFINCLGIDSGSCYARWKNDPDGEFTSSHLTFLTRLLSPDVRIVQDERGIVSFTIDCVVDHPISFFSTLIVCTSVTYAFIHGNLQSLYFWWNCLLLLAVMTISKSANTHDNCDNVYMAMYISTSFIVYVFYFMKHCIFDSILCLICAVWNYVLRVLYLKNGIIIVTLFQYTNE